LRTHDKRGEKVWREVGYLNREYKKLAATARAQTGAERAPKSGAQPVRQTAGR